MSKRNKQNKPRKFGPRFLNAQSLERRAHFEMVCDSLGMGTEVHNGGRHLRAIGVHAIDFWPSTGRWWQVGSVVKARREGLEDALRLAAAR